MFFESFWINSNPRSFSKAFYISSTSSVVKLEKKKPSEFPRIFFGGPPTSGVIWRIFSMSKIGVRSKTNDISINPATPFSSLPTIYKKGVDSPSFPRCISVLTLSTMVYCATKSGAAHIRKKKGGIIQIMTLMSAAVVRHSRPWSKAKLLLLAMHFLALFLLLLLLSPSLSLLLNDGSDMQEYTLATWNVSNTRVKVHFNPFKTFTFETSKL